MGEEERTFLPHKLVDGKNVFPSNIAFFCWPLIGAIVLFLDLVRFRLKFGKINYCKIGRGPSPPPHLMRYIDPKLCRISAGQHKIVNKKKFQLLSHRQLSYMNCARGPSPPPHIMRYEKLFLLRTQNFDITCNFSFLQNAFDCSKFA